MYCGHIDLVVHKLLKVMNQQHRVFFLFSSESAGANWSGKLSSLHVVCVKVLHQHWPGITDEN